MDFDDFELEEELSSSIPQVPVGDHTGTITETSLKGGTDKNGNEYLMVLGKVKIDSEDDTTFPPVPFSIYINLNSQGKILSGEGKNVKLGQFLKATGLNAPGNFQEKVRAAVQTEVTVRVSPSKNDPEYREITKFY